jgi:elongation factor P--(R)-beta-lysine ligase
MTGQGNWRPSATIEALLGRARVLRRIREFFDSRNFIEVQTPCLSRDVIVDRYIEPLSVDIRLPAGTETFWLQTSPEFAMKRLLAAGAAAIYQMGPVFRADETGNHHNVEFTMLEWYRAGDDYAAGVQLLDEFAQTIIGCPAARRLTYRDAFRKFANVDPFDGSLDDDQLNLLMAEKVEPGLATFPSVLLYDWPVGQAALAKIRIDNEGHPVAERFELYVQGVELANGYHELSDANELLQRNIRTNELRAQAGKARLPNDSRLLSAMTSGLPPASGVALGVDRLVMLMLKLKTIRDVIAFDSHNA